MKLSLVYRLVAGMVLIQGLLNAEESPRNLIKNSSFELVNEEEVPVDWNVAKNEGAVSIDSTHANDGKKCLHFVLDGKETLFTQRKYIQLEPGETMTFSAYVKTKDLEPSTGLQLQVINLGWSFGYQAMLPIKEGTADWTRYTKTFVVPAANAFKYQGMDNVEYEVVIYAKDARGEVWVDAIQLEAGKTATEYESLEGKQARSGDPVFDAVAADLKSGRAKHVKYFQVENPLFEELLGKEPGPRHVLYYGYNDLFVDEYRPYAKKFGLRYVQEEEVKELRAHPFVPMTNGWRRGGVGSYPTMRMILRPDAQGLAPAVFGTSPWIMDPRWQQAYVDAAVKLVEQSLDESPANEWGNTWGLWAGDEVFESAGNLVPPKEKRYDGIEAIDREIKEKFGFGKYGIPDSRQDPDPFRRIAFARWVNAKLTDLYQKTYETVKKKNPKLVMLGPDPCGGVPPVDLEAMTPYFDLVSNQPWYSPSSFTQQLATGADTKAMVDLSSCPVWALAQHTTANDPEALREQYSQVFRNGGEGLIILGVEWYDRELEHPKYVNPAKWRALLEITDTVTRMGRVKLPQPDTAILYASDTYLTFDDPKMANPDKPQMYSAYAAIGPYAGSWFRFVSDRQIDRGTRNLRDYKVLYVPLATYARGAVLDRIEQYIQGGGIVVCTDPTAFTWDINGDRLVSRWEKIAGVKIGKSRPTGADARARVVNAGFMKNAREIAITFPSAGKELSIAEASAKPFASFPDGSVAATIRAYGKGYVIFFGSDPFASVDKSAPVLELFKNIQASAGAKTNLDIWRFKLPPFKSIDGKDAEKCFCLTGNNVVIEENEVRTVHNLFTGGTYTYDHFPTRMADAAKAGAIAFADGHLTNRKPAYLDRKLGGEKNSPAIEKWMVSWTDKQPVAITFDLKKEYPLQRMKIFHSGPLPALNIQGSRDGKTWKPLGSHPASPATPDVIDVIVKLKGQGRYVRLEIGERESPTPMELVEMEIWGDKPHADGGVT